MTEYGDELWYCPRENELFLAEYSLGPHYFRIETKDGGYWSDNHPEDFGYEYIGELY